MNRGPIALGDHHGDGEVEVTPLDAIGCPKDGQRIETKRISQN